MILLLLSGCKSRRQSIPARTETSFQNNKGRYAYVRSTANANMLSDQHRMDFTTQLPISSTAVSDGESAPTE